MACLRQILDKPAPPLQKTTTLMESLSWNQLIRPAEPSPTTSFEMFGEIQFRETSTSTKPPLQSADVDGLPSSSSIPTAHVLLVRSPRSSRCPGGLLKHQYEGHPAEDYYCSTDRGFSLEGRSHEALQLCTKALLGDSEILDDADVVDVVIANESSPRASARVGWRGREEEGEEARRSLQANYIARDKFRRSCSDVVRPRSNGNGRFPPPITCIGAGGRPWIYFKSFRDDGRFVLKEISIPTQQCLQATRENGRLVLHSAHPYERETDQGDDDDGGGGREEEEEEKAEEEEKQITKSKAIGIGNGALQSMLIGSAPA